MMGPGMHRTVDAAGNGREIDCQPGLENILQCAMRKPIDAQPECVFAPDEIAPMRPFWARMRLRPSVNGIKLLYG
jgi:hypothetical protein